MVKAAPKFIFDWKTLFFLWGLQGCVAFVWLLSLPSDADRKGLLGVSFARSILLGGVALLTIGSFLNIFQIQITDDKPQMV